MTACTHLQNSTNERSVWNEDLKRIERIFITKDPIVNVPKQSYVPVEKQVDPIEIIEENVDPFVTIQENFVPIETLEENSNPIETLDEADSFLRNLCHLHLEKTNVDNERLPISLECVRNNVLKGSPKDKATLEFEMFLAHKNRINLMESRKKQGKLKHLLDNKIVSGDPSMDMQQMKEKSRDNGVLPGDETDPPTNNIKKRRHFRRKKVKIKKTRISQSAKLRMSQTNEEVGFGIFQQENLVDQWIFQPNDEEQNDINPTSNGGGQVNPISLSISQISPSEIHQSDDASICEITSV